MPSTKAPCGATIEGDTQAQMGQQFSQHQNGCSDCQQILAQLREEMFGPNTTDPRD